MKTLLLIDYINEILHPDGKLSGKGYSDFVKSHNTISIINSLLEKARDKEYEVVWVKVGFDEQYNTKPVNSLLFQNAPKYSALIKDTWATQIINDLDFVEGDKVFWKQSISAFHSQEILKHLANQKQSELFLAGVATDLAVSSSVFDAHDLDYKVSVIADACAAANEEDHELALRQIAKFAEVKNTDDL
jgi:nicotinamidase-related amidase